MMSLKKWKGRNKCRKIKKGVDRSQLKGNKFNDKLDANFVSFWANGKKPRIYRGRRKKNSEALGSLKDFSQKQLKFITDKAANKLEKQKETGLFGLQPPSLVYQYC